MTWPLVALETVAPPETPSIAIASSNPVWHLNLDQIESGTGRILSRIIAPFSEAGGSTYAFDTHNVLYSKLRPYLNKVVCPDEPGIATTELVPLRPIEGVLNRGFLTYFLRSKQFLEFASHTVSGAKMPRVIMNKFWSHKIPLPTPSEQQRVVDILDKATELRNRRFETDAKFKQALPALFWKAFGDPIANMSSSSLWPLERVDSVADISYGLSDQLDSSLTADQGTRIITISNVTLEGLIDRSIERFSPVDEVEKSKASVRKFDLLFNWRNGSAQHVGKTAIWEENWPGETLHVSFLLRLRPKCNRVEPYYLWALLNILRSSGYFSAQSRMQVNRKFNASEVAALRIPMPPLAECQRPFALQVEKLRQIRYAQQSVREHIEGVLENLLHRAFAGELTAQWREANKNRLDVELQEQLKALDRAKANGGTSKRRKQQTEGAKP
jgi:type I restriction enzyme, S subunit